MASAMNLITNISHQLVSEYLIWQPQTVARLNHSYKFEFFLIVFLQIIFLLAAVLGSKPINIFIFIVFSACNRQHDNKYNNELVTTFTIGRLQVASL